MNEVQKQYSDPDEIGLRELISVTWAGKWIVLVVTIIASLIASVYVFSLPNIYKSDVLLAAAEDSSLNIPGQLGGLAALAGVNLGEKGGDKTTLALQILKSRDFIGKFIEQNNLYIEIMAAEGWDRVTNSLVIDSEIYDSASNEWVREVKAPFKPKPSTMETFDEFKKLFSVNQDKTSGMITVSIEHYSPYLAKEWVDRLVKAINEDMRQRDLAEAERSIAYLNSKIDQTNIADVRSMLFSLIEEQTKTVMLANVREEYVLKTIDPAVVSEKKAKPNRILIIILTTILSSMIAVFGVIILHFNRRHTESLNINGH
ncbi:MAG: LPS O-antigen length regulator [Gammaproteobacteria bacterium]|nr:LPS O-antigen length regulator [Gammaproteobacteria bacterium]MBU2058439.1 LPS O-antigen length regulator [Gammaproteobacteria bacterium]MBU2176508.1 LPS O-antigen length regulator [Gammaproteobacteria bacterium]MBU2248550.1 LPS O-antigen length regulator [Gammaproteobacteria bacterium]MBU2345587.1 LPS O-antigen length regulator [Gammaproteobacteria bacterium]